MISKVTVENSEALRERFKEITTALQAAGKDYSVNNLEEYYANIVDIAELSVSNGDPYKYFLMPVDEPMFEIDANTRKITVPQHFAKNGVGVHGDHMAEVLYFRIDRYFDYQDLYKASDIVINWQFRPANMSRNTEVQTHTSFALAPDETYDPGHIVFGWVIGNYVEEKDENNNPAIAYMTGSRGTLTFSVSFIRRNAENEFDYIFNTQTASVNIYDSLTIEDGAKLDRTNKPMFKRLINSSYTPEGLNPLIAPAFLYGKEFDDGDGIKRYTGLYDSANFEFSTDKKSEEDVLQLKTVAKIQDDADTILYQWTGVDYEGNYLGGSKDGITRTEIDYIETIDGAYQENKKYFKYDVEQRAYIPIESETAFDALIEDQQKIYEAGNIQDINIGGSYMVTISSQKTAHVNGEDLSATSSQVDSNVCFIPKAAIPKVTLSVPSSNDQDIFDASEKFDNCLIKLSTQERKDFVEKDDKQVLLDYKYYDQEITNSLPPAIVANIVIDKNKVETKHRDEETNQEVVLYKGVTSASSLGFVKLYLVNNGIAPSETEYKDVSEGHGTYVPNGESIDITFDREDASGAGTWQAYAVNERNHTFSLSDISNEIYVSKVAPSLNMTLQGRALSLGAEGLTVESAAENAVTVIRNNKKVAGYDAAQNQGITIANAMTGVRFHVSFDDITSDLKEDSEILIEAIELDQNDTTYKTPLDENETKNGKEYLPNSYQAVPNEDGTDYTFDINEGGLFVIKATTTYHGTKRITLTQPFLVSVS